MDSDRVIKEKKKDGYQNDGNSILTKLEEARRRIANMKSRKYKFGGETTVLSISNDSSIHAQTQKSDEAEYTKKKLIVSRDADKKNLAYSDRMKINDILSENVTIDIPQKTGNKMKASPAAISRLEKAKKRLDEVKANTILSVDTKKKKLPAHIQAAASSKLDEARRRLAIARQKRGVEESSKEVGEVSGNKSDYLTANDAASSNFTRLQEAKKRLSQMKERRQIIMQVDKGVLGDNIKTRIVANLENDKSKTELYVAGKSLVTSSTKNKEDYIRERLRLARQQAGRPMTN
eukprot:UC4_evm1s1492